MSEELKQARPDVIVVFKSFGRLVRQTACSLMSSSDGQSAKKASTLNLRRGIGATIVLPAYQLTRPQRPITWYRKTICRMPSRPRFFRAEVLSKYKNDPDKYTINEEHRSISCRGSWDLRSYGISEAGQVYAYICDLMLLPL